MSKLENENYNQIISSIKEAYRVSDEDAQLSNLAKDTINGIINKIQFNNNLDFKEKLSLLVEEIEKEIKKCLFVYDEQELIIGLLYLKASFRSTISLSSFQQEDYEFVNRHSEILHLIRIVLQNRETEFKGECILNNNYNLAMSFNYAYYINTIVDNMNVYNATNTNSQFNTNLFNVLKGGFFYTDEYNEFMDSMLNVSSEVIPEESEIHTLKLQQYLKKKGYYIETISDEVNDNLSDSLKFKINHIHKFCFNGTDDEKKVVYCNKNEYIEKIKNFFPMENIDFENIISLFSLNNINAIDIDIKNVELRSIYQIDNTLIFYPFDLCWNISCFEKFLIRNHFTEMYFNSLSLENLEKLKKGIRKTESKISTYLAYVLSEQMFMNGYSVPIDSGIPMAEINCIEQKQNGCTVNLLKSGKDYGDIDVLAADKNKKQIYNIEIKFFKPLINLKELSDPYKLKDRNKYIDKAKDRENIIKKYMPDVLSILDENENTDYTVRTIIVSTRPDYWLKKNKSVEYFDWVDFLKKIKNNDL